MPASCTSTDALSIHSNRHHSHSGGPGYYSVLPRCVTFLPPCVACCGCCPPGATTPQPRSTGSGCPAVPHAAAPHAPLDHLRDPRVCHGPPCRRLRWLHGCSGLLLRSRHCQHPQQVWQPTAAACTAWGATTATLRPLRRPPQQRQQPASARRCAPAPTPAASPRPRAPLPTPAPPGGPAALPAPPAAAAPHVR